MGKQYRLGIFLVLASATGVVGCASSTGTPKEDMDVGGGGGGDDLSVVDLSSTGDAANTTPPDLIPLKQFGDPCTDKSECGSDICIFTGLGGVCSKLCSNDPCPQGYGCYGVLGAIDPGVVSEVCVPENNLICSACTNDQQCGNGAERDLCLPSPSGATFCSRDCSTIGCPAGYQCKSVAVGDAGTFQQCVPNSGACDCNDVNKGITKPCTITTPYSVCTTPSITCNGSASGWGACTPPSTTDKPDDNFTDSNCDGIDGDLTKAVFVDCLGGTDANNGLTPAKAVATINRGITVASALGFDVYVSKCTYTGPVLMAAGVGVYGGYDASNKWQRSNSNVTTISGYSPAVQFDSINAETHLELFTVIGADATGTGGSSYGIRVRNSAGPIYVRTSTVKSGTATGGFVASNGAAGQGKNNNPGGLNYDGQTPGGSTGGAPGQSACGSNGGKGGDGHDGNNGDPGASGNGPSQVTGGGGGPSCGSDASNACGCSHSYNPGPGNQGPDGSVGGNGGAALSIGSISGYDYAPASGSDGTDGQNGSGGSGGGAGGGSYDSCFISCCDTDTGGGGGGGGAGGCHGAHGTAGGGGGASFAIFAFGSTLFVDKCSLTSGKGGDGRNGGNGGTGGTAGGFGNGGPGTTDDADGQPGAQGGAGGRGGAGGSGSGGTGGPSACIGQKSSSVMDTGGSCIPGSGGAAGGGGSNGSTTAPPGQPGQSGPTLTLN
jgi:hypothetical protein